MKRFGTVPRQFGSKRGASPEIARLLAILNEDDPHVYRLPFWPRAVDALRVDLGVLQAIAATDPDANDARFFEGSILIPMINHPDRRDPFDDGVGFRPRWSPPFIPPNGLFVGGVAAA